MRYFTLEEFASPDIPNSGELMDAKFLQMLDNARAKANVPFRITSGYRSEEHNKKVGGVQNSSHLRGYAADISITKETGMQILSALIEAGFRRVGIAKTFIHIDNDPEKPNRVWTY